jgi:hypothetical protein
MRKFALGGCCSRFACQPPFSLRGADSTARGPAEWTPHPRRSAIFKRLERGLAAFARFSEFSALARHPHFFLLRNVARNRSITAEIQI